MHPGGYNPRPNTAPYGAYCNNAGAGFRNGSSSANAPPYRQPPQQQQMTPQQREEVLMAAGRLAAEYLVSTGELSPHVLQSRLPAPLPFQERRPPVPRPRHDQQTFPRPFQQERPLARQHFQFRPPAPLQFQQRPFAPRPFQGQGRPIAKRPRPSFQGRPPASHLGRFQARPPFPSGVRAAAPSRMGHNTGQGGAAPAGSVTQGDLNDAPAAAGDANNSQPVAQSTDTAQSLQMMD